MTLCKNEFHELDPSDLWRGPNGERCFECYRAKKIRGANRYNQTQKRVAVNARYNTTVARRESTKKYRSSEKGHVWLRRKILNQELERRSEHADRLEAKFHRGGDHHR